MKTVPTIGLRLARLGCIGFSKRKTVSEKPEAESLGTSSKDKIHKVYGASSDYPWKKTDRPWVISEVFMLWKCEDRSHEETGRQQRCAREQGLESLPENIQAQRKLDKSYILLALGRMGTILAASTRRAGGEWVFGRFRSKYAYGQQERPWLLLKLETMRIIEKSDDGDDGQRRCAKQDKKPQCVSKNWTHSWRWCFLKKLPQFTSLGEALRRSWNILTTGPAVKNPHLTKNGKRVNCNISNYVPFVVPGLSTKFFNFIFTWFFNIFIAGFCDRKGKSSKRSEIKEGVSYGVHPLHGSAETKNTNNNDDDKVRSELLQDLPDWLQEFRENLFGELHQGHGEPVAWTSWHFQFFSWIANGAASKSGSGFGYA